MQHLDLLACKTYVQFSIPVSPVTKSAIELMVFSLHNSYRTASADKNTTKFRYKFDSSYKLGQNTVNE